MKFFIVLFAVIIGGIIGFLTVLQNGVLLRFLDTHPHPKYVPTVEYSIGAGYYLLNDLQNAATYYQRIPDRYPQSSFADDATFNYLQSLDEENVERDTMRERYLAYLEKYPSGKHVDVVKKRVDLLQSRH
jgi:hypothetical protein